MSINTFVAIGITQIRKAVDCAISPSWESYFYFFFYSLHLFKVEPKPRYVNRTQGMLAGSVAFLPPFVQHHDMAHLNPSLFTPFVHTQPQHVLPHSKSCLLPPWFTTSLPGQSHMSLIKFLCFIVHRMERNKTNVLSKHISHIVTHYCFPKHQPLCNNEKIIDRFPKFCFQIIRHEYYLFYFFKENVFRCIFILHKDKFLMQQLANGNQVTHPEIQLHFYYTKNWSPQVQPK